METKPAEKIYPDTTDGVIDCFVDDSIYNREDIVSTTPDYVVKGVWKLDLKNGNSAIVYLAGYETIPGGEIRDMNDFEEYEPA